MKIPNPTCPPKLEERRRNGQTPTKSQIPTSNRGGHAHGHGYGHEAGKLECGRRLRWDLGFGILLGFGIWSLGFPAAFANDLPAHLDWFPSREYAVIYRNWDVVPPARLASVLGTDIATLHKAGESMGLAVPAALTPEELRRNIEIILRRNWEVVPRAQIDGLLGMTAAETDDFLAKEIFLRAHLAGAPPGLAEVRWTDPDGPAKARLTWFASKMKTHLDAAKDVPEEARLGYVADLCRPHDPADFVPGTEPQPGDADLRSGWSIQIPSSIGVPASNGQLMMKAIEDFRDYCQQVQHIKDLPEEVSNKPPPPGKKVIRLQGAWPYPPDEAFTLKVRSDYIQLSAPTELGLARGLVELERRMSESGGPFLAPAKRNVHQPAFSPRYVFPYFSLMTDVLGQDLIDPFPDGYLARLFHQDADGVWIYALLEDLVPSPVFGELSTGTADRLRRLRAIVDRAAKRGLKVYMYLNEPRAKPLAFFEKHPDAKGRTEGATAALCTSSEIVQKHLRGSFEKLFREVPGLGGVFVITASENLTNCYAHGLAIDCERCKARKPQEVVAESIRAMAEGTWAAAPEAKFIVWDWSWHSVLKDDACEDLVKGLPKNVILMADFERGTPIERGGQPRTCDEYSISVVGPSPRAKLRAEQAKRNGLGYAVKIQLSNTWECGHVPFIPVPGLLARKARAMRDLGVSTVMATWTIGSHPSPNTEAFSLVNWNGEITEEEALKRVALRRYGPGAVAEAVRGWTTMGDAFTEEFPFSWAIYTGPFLHGPSLPWCRRPWGPATLLNPRDGWKHWVNAYTPEGYAAQLRKLCDRWAPGLADLKTAAAKAAGPRRRTADRDYGVAWMVDYTYRAFADGIDFYRARDGGDAEGMKKLAARQLVETTEAFRRVRADSRFGWEAELQYVYRPLDVLERLLSLDAVLDPPP